ncbi:16S rRNA processing protein RimM [Helicobacter sp. 16-1353]|uniref:ribosome maturation factor RimM n=1 Tax=Helicobacter sp. 16-1353 TaxID=2004996 RepID=UPI000DCBC07E|nr:ribosome maturation factor RimM [Helicobacter sp. 16-1353]RAX52071.1 16S rRNA processing protein RimM [Helicobacter sp. 16-1353]
MQEKFDILVAKCGKSIGLKGEIHLNIYSDFLDIFTRGNIFRCGDLMLTLESFNVHKNSAKFSEINDIESAKMLNSHNLYSSKTLTEKYCNLGENEFFWFDIIGLKIYDGDLLLGEVAEIERIVGVDYLVVNVDRDLLDSGASSNFGDFGNSSVGVSSKNSKKKPKQKIFLIPYIERYIIKTDLKNKRILTQDTLGILEES